MNNENKTNINWYPGHMAKAIREINEKVKLVDVVIVLLDARVPHASFNPELKKMLQNKRTLYILTKKDKADDIETKKWLTYYQKQNIRAISINTKDQKEIKQVYKELENIMADKRISDAKKGLRPRPIKTMMTGIPNVGNSTLINALVGKKVTIVGDKPGVTKNQQWIRINQNIELLDTPGVLWPKFEDETIGFNLAITGAIKDSILPVHDIAKYFVEYLDKYYPSALNLRYKETLPEDSESTITKIGEIENIRFGNKEVNVDETSRYLLQLYRNNAFGKITLDRVTYEESNN